MKGIRAAILLAAAALILGACGPAGSGEQTKSDRIRRIESGADWVIFVDTETGVEYITNGDAITALVDFTGKPYIANGWRDWGGDDAED